MLDSIGKMAVFAQKGASEIEPLGFLHAAGAKHVTYLYFFL